MAWTYVYRKPYKKLRYRDTCQIDLLIANNGWDTKYDLLSSWEYEKPIFKKVRFDKEFMPYPHIRF